MFNNTFYPTPETIANKMLEGIDFTFIQTVLEPSAGKGDLIAAVQAKNDSNKYSYNHHSIDIDAVEIDPNLRVLLKGNEIRVVHDNFLTMHTSKHYDLIIMNPPFNEGDKHLLKALEMQQNGGRVVCLLNAETIRNPYSNTRKDLVRKLKEYDASIEYVPNAFRDAERKTDVEVAIVKVKIPEKKPESKILQDLRKESVIPEEENESSFGGIVVNDVIKAAVQSYEFELKAGFQLIDEFRAIAPTLSTSFEDNSTPILSLKVDGKDANKNVFVKSIRRKYWRALLDNKEFSGLLTSNLRDQYYSKINELVDYDFSLYNIYSVRLEMSQQMCKGVEETIVDLFDEFSHKHYWSECSNNIHYYNGWKTNSAYKINKKVIIPLRGWRDLEYSWGGFNPTHYDVVKKLHDMERVFDYLDGGEDTTGYMEQILRAAEQTEQSRKISCKYFYLTFYKKGTCHIEFKDQRLLDKFNIFGSQHKGWLPPSYGKKSYQTMTKEEQAVVDEFQGEKEYEKVMANKDYYMFDSSSVLMLEGNL